MSVPAETRPTIAADDGTAEEIKTDKVTEWPQPRVLRRLTLMRSLCKGAHTFDGPKHLALERMVRQGVQQGSVTVIILPVSPIYAQEFLPSETLGRFEASLTELERSVPQARWVHLERLSELHSNELYWDFVHMNVNGQRIATDELLRQLDARRTGDSE